MYVSARERKLIEYLLDAHDPLPVRSVAKQLDVSSRTVHRDLNSLESILREQNLFLSKQAGKGVQITGPEHERNELRNKLYEQKALDYTPEERKILILSRLLESKEPMKLINLANDLGVTVATTSSDLDQMEAELLSFDLQLVKRRGYGVEVKGNEARIREAIQHMMMQHMDEYELLKLLRQRMDTSGTLSKLDDVSEHLLGLVNKERIQTIEQVVETYRTQLTYPLADSAYIGLVIHLSLAMERLKQGEVIKMEPEHLDNLRPTTEFDIARKMILQLEERLELNIPEAEIGYITMHLMGAKARYNQDSVIEDSSLSIAFKTKQLIEFVSNALQRDLHGSDKLLNDLVVHLKPSLYRIQQSMEISNPLMQQIEEDYTELYLIVEEAVKHVFPSLTFPKEETAFLVMHFASALLNMEDTKKLDVLVVCSSGIGTAKILAAKLKQQFHEIETVDHQSVFDIEKLSLEKYDLVVSTIPLDKVEEYVLVNPMLSTSDIHRMQHRIRKVRMIAQMKRADPEVVREDQTLQSIRDSVAGIQHYVETISHLINHLYVFHSEEPGKEKIIHEVVGVLEQKNVLKSKVKVAEVLLKRETAGGLGIPGTGIALYHTRMDDIPTPSFSMVNLNSPITIQGMDGIDMAAYIFVLLLAPRDLSREGLEVVSFLSTLFIEDDQSIEVMKSGNEEKMKGYVSNKLHQFMKEKIPS